MGKQINLGHYKDCILYVSEPGVGISIAEKDPGLRSETVLNRIIPDYAKIGHAIVCGISGSLFGKEATSNYGRLRSDLEKITDEIVSGADRKGRKSLYECVRSRLADDIFMTELKSRTEGEEIAAKMMEYVELTEGAMKKASERYDALGGVLANQERVLAIRGVNDRSTSDWPLVKDSAISSDWIKDPRFVIAYLGGSNYNLSPGNDIIEDDAPADLRETKDPTDIHKFLKNPFDLLVFSGSYSVMKAAVDAVNKELSERKRSLFGLGKKPSGVVKNRIVIVNNPYMKRPEQHIVNDGSNVLVTGLNFGRDKNLLLIDYRNRALSVLELRIEAPKGFESLEKGIGDVFEVLDSKVVGRDGVLGEWDIEESSDEARRERGVLEIGQKIGRLDTSFFGRFISSPVSAVKQKGFARRVLPYVIGASVGAGATYLAMRSGKLEEAVQQYVNELQTKNAELQRRDNILEGMRKNIDSVRKKLEESNK